MILFVDDEPVRMRPWTYALEAAGYEVLVVDDAAQAIRAFHRDDLDFVFLDLMMPTSGDLDDQETEYGTRTGLVLLRQLRDAQRQVGAALLTHAGVSVLTNVGEPDLIDVAAALGATYHRKRDLTPNKLVTLLRDKGIHPRTTPTPPSTTPPPSA